MTILIDRLMPTLMDNIHPRYFIQQSNKAGEEAVSSGQLKTILGKLPDDVPLEPESVSGILCAQVGR